MRLKALNGHGHTGRVASGEGGVREGGQPVSLLVARYLFCYMLYLIWFLTSFCLKGALQLLIIRYGQIRFAQVPEPKRVSTKSFVVLIIGNSKSFHLGAQGTGHL